MVEPSVRAFIEAHPEVKDAPEAALAIAAAQMIDDRHASVTSRAMMSGRLLEALAQLRAMIPEDHEESPLDQIRVRLTVAEDRVSSGSRDRSPSG